jgi:hypothetical protein
MRTNKEIKKTKNYHRGHRGINVLKKEKITENSGETKDFVGSVTSVFSIGWWDVAKQNKNLCVLCGKNSGAELLGLCGF